MFGFMAKSSWVRVAGLHHTEVLPGTGISGEAVVVQPVAGILGEISRAVLPRLGHGEEEVISPVRSRPDLVDTLPSLTLGGAINVCQVDGLGRGGGGQCE